MNRYNIEGKKDPYIAPGVNVRYWSEKEKPCLNHWYRLRLADDVFWKIVKDYYDPERQVTLYKIVEYYSGDNLYCGCALWQVRQIIKETTYQSVF